MPTNPITDRYLADVANDSYRHPNCPPGGCPVEQCEARWRSNFLATLPDVDDAIIGKVLLHLGATISAVLNQTAVRAVPGLLPRYLRNLLQTTGADLINPDSDTADTTAAQPKAATE